MKALCTVVCILSSVAVLVCAGMYVVEAYRLAAAAWNGGLRDYWLFAGWSENLAYQLGRVFGGLVLPGVGIWGFGRLAQYCGLKAEM